MRCVVHLVVILSVFVQIRSIEAQETDTEKEAEKTHAADAILRAKEEAPRGEFGGGILRWDSSPYTAGFLNDPALVAALRRGPATADHLLRVGIGLAPRLCAIAHGSIIAPQKARLSRAGL